MYMQSRYSERRLERKRSHRRALFVFRLRFAMLRESLEPWAGTNPPARGSTAIVATDLRAFCRGKNAINGPLSNSGQIPICPRFLTKLIWNTVANVSAFVQPAGHQDICWEIAKRPECITLSVITARGPATFRSIRDFADIR